MRRSLRVWLAPLRASCALAGSIGRTGPRVPSACHRGASWPLARTVLAIASLAVLSIAGPARAAPAPDPPRRTFTERVEVRVINLEAVVVDGQGRRVGGLGAGDLSLEVDGAPVPIDYFSEISEGHAAAPAADAAADPPAPPPGVGEPGERVPTNYLVFIDSYFTRLADRRNRILRQIESNLALLGPQDRMAIVAFTGRKLRPLSDWSGDAARLGRGLAAARKMPACGFITRDRAVINDTCSRIELVERRIGRLVAGVTAALRSFGRPPGRRVMLLLSGGWPQSARHALVGSQPFAGLECPHEGPAIYRPIHETANRLGYTLYPVDMPPPSSSLAVSAALSGPLDAAGITGANFEVHATLRMLARETGGTAMIDGAAEGAFRTVVDDTRTYYWLGFTPEWRGDDDSHKVRLRVLVPGLEVRARRGYVDLSLETEISNVTEGALLFGNLPGAHPLGLEIGRMPDTGRGRLKLPVRLTIPMDAIAMLPRKGGWAAELELRVAVVDDGGNRNEMPIIPVLIEGPEPPPPGAHSIYETELKMRRRPHDLVVSLYDPMSDTILAATGSVGPGRAP